MKKLTKSRLYSGWCFAIGVCLLVGGILFVTPSDAQRGDLYGGRALLALEQAFKTTGVLTFPNYAAAPVVCNAANLGVYYYDTTLGDIRICGAGPAWVVVGAGGFTVGTAATLPMWNAVPDDLVDSSLTDDGTTITFNAMAVTPDVQFLDDGVIIQFVQGLAFEDGFQASLTMSDWPNSAAAMTSLWLVQIGENSSLPAMDGDDTWNMLFIDFTNPNHTGANNFLYGLNIDGIVQDDNALETMFYAGAGWDIDLGFADADSLNIAPLGQSNMVTIYDVPATGTTGSLVEISATFDAMDATIQTYRGLYINLIEPAPAAAISMVHGIDIASLNAIGYILDSAIYVDSGWLADIRFNEPAAHVIWAEGGSLEFSDWSIWEGLTTPGDPHNQVIFRDAAADNAVPTALVEIDPLLSIMDGAGDVQRVLYLDIDNVNHADGTVYGIDIDIDAGDANADEYAINIGAGWDHQIYFNDDTTSIRFGTTAFNWSAAFADGGGINLLQIYGEQHVADVSFLFVGALGPANLSTIIEVAPRAELAMNGNDTHSAIVIDLANANHTGASNFLYGLNIDALGGGADPDATEAAVHLDAGWDYALWVAGTTQDIDHGLTAAVFLAPTLAANDDAADQRNVLLIDIDIPNGSAGLVNGINIDAVTDDTDTIDSAIMIEGGWDSAITIFERGSVATSNPLTGSIYIYLDDSADYSGGGGNDCWLVVRDNAGNNHELLQIILDGACP